MKLYLIRHGETTSDVEDRYGGSYDDHLTPRGVSQADELVRELHGVGIQAFFTSPLIRARETADILSNGIGVNIEEVVEDLRERNFCGKLTGMVKKEAREKFPKLVEELEADKYATIDGAEEFEHFRNRIGRAFLELTQKPFETIAVVTHGGPLWLLFKEVFNAGEVKRVDDCGFAIIQSQNGIHIVERTEGFLF